jgi:hypothetical protein
MGRIGNPGRVRRLVCQAEVDARAVFDRQTCVKERRGYVRTRLWPQIASVISNQAMGLSLGAYCIDSTG